MKIKHRALSLLLALAMVLTFMPAMAFAASDASTPVSISFSSTSPVDGYIGSTSPQIFKDGVSVTVKYSSGKSSTFKYVGEKGDEIYGDFYLNGDVTKDRLDGIWATTDSPIKAGNNQATLVYQYDESDYDKRVESHFTVVGTKNSDIKSVAFKQKNPLTVEYRNRYDWAYDNDKAQLGNELTVSYTNGDSRVYTYMENPEYAGDYSFFCKLQDEGETWYESAYPEFVFAKEPGDWSPGNSYKGDVYYDGVKADGAMTVSVNAVATPTGAKFVASGGKAINAMIGQDYLDLQGKGNKIIITYSDGTKRTYTFKNSREGFVYKDSKGNTDSIWGTITLNKRVKKGTNTAKGKISVWNGEDDKEYRFSISAKTKASKYYTFVIYRGYQYTGKKITPKVTVKYYNGKKIKTMPKSWYTAAPKKNTKIGEYSFKVNFKSKYQKKYGKSIKGFYEIEPKKPVIVSAEAGVGSITVKWKKFGAAERKNIDGFQISCHESCHECVFLAG